MSASALAAIVLIGGTLPFWICAAVIWGLIRATQVLRALANYASEEGFEWGVAIMLFVKAVGYGIISAWNIPLAMWDWGKAYPLWAVMIGLASVALRVIFGRGRGGRSE